MTPHIPKDHPDLPDNYEITVHFVSGKKEVMEVATHRIVDTIILYDDSGNLEDQNGKRFRFVPAAVPLFECWKKDDLLFTAPLTSISHLEFDKRFSKIKAIRAKMREEEKNKSKLCQ